MLNEVAVDEGHLEGCLSVCLPLVAQEGLATVTGEEGVHSLALCVSAPLCGQVPYRCLKAPYTPWASHYWILWCAIKIGTSRASVCPAAVGGALSIPKRTSCSGCTYRASPWSELLRAASDLPTTHRSYYCRVGVRLFTIKEVGTPIECSGVRGLVCMAAAAGSVEGLHTRRAHPGPARIRARANKPTPSRLGGTLSRLISAPGNRPSRWLLRPLRRPVSPSPQSDLWRRPVCRAFLLPSFGPEGTCGKGL